MALSKKVCGCCHIFTLAKVLTIVELVVSILIFVFFLGVKFSKFGGITWWEWVFDTINMVCLGLEYVGIYKKIFGLVIFSCVYRCINLLLYILGLIAIIIISRYPEIITDLGMVSPTWYVTSALCTIFIILLTLSNSEQKNGLLIKLFCFSSDFDETW